MLEKGRIPLGAFHIFWLAFTSGHPPSDPPTHTDHHHTYDCAHPTEDVSPTRVHVEALNAPSNALTHGEKAHAPIEVTAQLLPPTRHLQ